MYVWGLTVAKAKAIAIAIASDLLRCVSLARSVSVPESWASFSNANVQRSQAERAASRQLRDELDALLARTHDDIWREWNAVNVAFTQRIAEQQDAKFKTETHLQKACLPPRAPLLLLLLLLLLLVRSDLIFSCTKWSTLTL